MCCFLSVAFQDASRSNYDSKHRSLLRSPDRGRSTETCATKFAAHCEHSFRAAGGLDELVRALVAMDQAGSWRGVVKREDQERLGVVDPATFWKLGSPDDLHALYCEIFMHVQSEAPLRTG